MHNVGGLGNNLYPQGCQVGTWWTTGKTLPSMWDIAVFRASVLLGHAVSGGYGMRRGENIISDDYAKEVIKTKREHMLLA